MAHREVRVVVVEQLPVREAQGQLLKDSPADCHNILVHRILSRQVAVAVLEGLVVMDHFHQISLVVLVE
jgi:hypothetical protein